MRKSSKKTKKAKRKPTRSRKISKSRKGRKASRKTKRAPTKRRKTTKAKKPIKRKRGMKRVAPLEKKFYSFDVDFPIDAYPDSMIEAVGGKRNAWAWEYGPFGMKAKPKRTIAFQYATEAAAKRAKEKFKNKKIKGLRVGRIIHV